MGRKVLTDYPEAMQKQIVAGLAPKPETVLVSRPMSGKTAIIQSALSPCIFIVPIQPMGKPRMTQQDKWKKRDVVVRYRAYADKLREFYCGTMAPVAVSWDAYFAMPESWPAKKKADMIGKPHQQKPDRDNIDKGILDALWKDDAKIAFGTLRKFWDDGKGARIEITIS